MITAITFFSAKTFVFHSTSLHPAKKKKWVLAPAGVHVNLWWTSTPPKGRSRILLVIYVTEATMHDEDRKLDSCEILPPYQGDFMPHSHTLENTVYSTLHS